MVVVVAIDVVVVVAVIGDEANVSRLLACNFGFISGVVSVV